MVVLATLQFFINTVDCNWKANMTQPGGPDSSVVENGEVPWSNTGLLKYLNGQFGALKQDNEEFRRRIELLEEDVTDLTEQIIGLKEDVADLTERIIGLEKNVAGLTEQVKFLIEVLGH